ncbi:TetR/AcrR family transcriptional regulator [Arthrobacter agilis]|uniref:TetR/AcrR family transcriptional regulator n=1 Tax=Arthrobacter agilis TaxID=37921 RepID=UPI00278B5AF0|nr:TetR/AcrR family transcriptional regulator [Arthrobacter agilis]MDQ0733884.1 AcrR family transcriptional regulator [Arthrobacter agilis]
MAGTPRERAREQTLSDITLIGRRQLGEVGAAALSLRAVARELGVVSSAVYRYVANRDELLTLLVVDAYTELGDEVDAAVASAAPAAVERFTALAGAVRSWAVREPSRYALLYGSPVPGYAAPGERTTAQGTRVVTLLARIVDDAWRAGDLHGAAGPAPAHLAGDYAALRGQLSLAAPDHVLAATVQAWSALVGAVSFEVFGQYGADTFADPDALHHYTVERLAAQLGLRAAGEQGA